MEKIWLKHYQAGVPEEIQLDQFSSVVDMMLDSCRENKTKQAFSNLGVGLTFTDLDELSLKFASYCQNVCGIQRGDRFAVMMPNVLQYPVSMFGIQRAGGVVVNVNPMYTAHELKHLLEDSGAKGIIVLENFANVVEQAVPGTNIEHVVIAKMGDLLGTLKGTIVNLVVKHVKKMVPHYHLPKSISFKKAIQLGRKNEFKAVILSLEDIAYLQYTGATTGTAKGAVLTHKNMVANVTQAKAWIEPIAKTYTLEGGIITALPLYHIFSLTANCLTFMCMGITNILITNPRDIKGFIKELKQHKFCAITGVNTLFNALLNHKDFDSIDFSSLRLTLGGGMAVQRAVAEKWQKITGKPLLEAYGLTEASPAVCINPANLSQYNGTIGLPIPSTEISIRDDDGKELGLNTPGELWVRGPQVMREYWKQPEKTKEVLTEDGWLKTGDVAVVDPDGFVKIVDRKKDLILVSGFNVYPNEVEDVIALHPKVKEVAVVGVPAGVRGEVVKAFIVRKDASLEEHNIIEHCKQYLTAYKIPKVIEFRDELPKTNVGKVLRRELREGLA